MDNMDLYSLASSSSFCHLMESEEGFPFGAKTTSFLPPATVTNASTNNTMAAHNTTAFDLPEWMEGRELLELPDVGLFDNMPASQPSTPLEDSLMKMDEEEEDYCFTIKPEDMLVPLSELQPPTTPTPPPLASTPPASPVHCYSNLVPANPPQVHASPPRIPAPAPAAQVQASAPLPKIIICRKVGTSTLKTKPVKVHYQVMPVKKIPQVTPGTPLVSQTPLPVKQVPQISCGTPSSTHTPLPAPTAAPGNSLGGQTVVRSLVASQGKLPTTGSYMDVPQVTVSAEELPPCDAEELINEMVQIIGDNNNANTFFQGLEVEEGMEELLLKLEASNKANSEPDSQASLSVPVPSASPSSFGSASPHPSETTFSGSISSPAHSESTFPSSPLSLPSPVPSLGSLSPAQSTSDSLFPPDETSSTEDCLEDWSPLEETHSYSKSTRKSKSSRRTSSARKAPYPEDRKERKKEQNKQAALRYRQKKKQEEDDLMGKIEVEEERQEKLRATYKGLKQELGYLKKIMREMFMAKGMLSEEALKKAALAKKTATK